MLSFRKLEKAEITDALESEIKEEVTPEQLGDDSHEDDVEKFELTKDEIKALKHLATLAEKLTAFIEGHAEIEITEEKEEQPEELGESEEVEELVEEPTEELTEEPTEELVEEPVEPTEEPVEEDELDVDDDDFEDFDDVEDEEDPELGEVSKENKKEIEKTTVKDEAFKPFVETKTEKTSLADEKPVLKSRFPNARFIDVE